MRRLESILVKTKTFKMFVMSLKCVLFMSIIAFLSQRKLFTYYYYYYYYYYEMTQRQCAYRGVHLIERIVDVDVCTKRSRD